MLENQQGFEELDMDSGNEEGGEAAQNKTTTDKEES